MRIGVPKEIKTNENRIALVPAGAEALVAAGHTVVIERGGGEGSGFADSMYTDVGATIAPDAAAVWRDADMIMKVKEPIESEWKHMRRGQVIFTYFHFAADERLTRSPNGACWNFERPLAARLRSAPRRLRPARRCRSWFCPKSPAI